MPTRCLGVRYIIQKLGTAARQVHNVIITLINISPVAILMQHSQDEIIQGPEGTAAGGERLLARDEVESRFGSARFASPFLSGTFCFPSCGSV